VALSRAHYFQVPAGLVTSESAEFGIDCRRRSVFHAGDRNRLERLPAPGFDMAITGLRNGGDVPICVIRRDEVEIEKCPRKVRCI
jgi:hypothetical protein